MVISTLVAHILWRGGTSSPASLHVEMFQPSGGSKQQSCQGVWIVLGGSSGMEPSWGRGKKQKPHQGGDVEGSSSCMAPDADN